MVIAAPNGARRTRADHPALPVTANELADCAAALPDLGVSVLHLHVRDREGQHTLDPHAYRAAMRRIGARTGTALVVQITTEAMGRYSADEQMAVVRELRPEAVSLALRELCPDRASETAAAGFFAWLVAERIWPQYILHSAADLKRFEALRHRGLFADDQPSCLLVLGRFAEHERGEPAELSALLSSLDPGISWAVCCFGPREHDAALAALEKGGHVRIGFENNLLLADGSLAADNAALVAQFTATLVCSKRRAATADEVRDEFIGGRS
jgi:3-keto-5-aminohexanoate cleavage enzyme